MLIDFIEEYNEGVGGDGKREGNEGNGRVEKA